MRSLFRILSHTTVSVAALLSACGGGDSGGTGTLKLALTDAPACGYDAINVTIEKVRVHQSASAAESEAGWSEIVLTPPRRVDLLSLTNGVLEELGQVSLPTGRYSQLRLVLGANGPGNAMANSIVPSASKVETALATPSASQSGLKLNVQIDIAENQVADFVLDFSACKSVVRLGNNNYHLKPVLDFIPRVSDLGMRVVGYVATALDPATTNVSVQAAGKIHKATAPDSTGKFTLYPVPAGTYDLVVSGAGRVPAIVTGVVVTNTAYAHINTATTPIDPPAQGSLRTISGTVTAGAPPIDADIEIVKKYTGGPNVIVAGAPVNGSTGQFAHTVMSGAAMRAVFSPTLAPLAFSADPANPSGLYTVNAIFGGVAKPVDVNVSTADATNLSFMFP